LARFGGHFAVGEREGEGREKKKERKETYRRDRRKTLPGHSLKKRNRKERRVD